MSQLAWAVCNLAVNAAVGFLIASAVVALALRVFRVGASRWRLVLWTLPFAKALWEVLRGIPDSAYLWSHPVGETWERGSMSVGLDFTAPAVVSARVLLSALAGGGTYALSVGDLAASALARGLSPLTLTLLMAGGLAVSAIRVLLRGAGFVRFERDRRRTRAESPSPRMERRRVGPRTVEVYVSSAHEGAPFTGGVLRPYVCFPAATFDSLTPEQREAVLQHELAHVAGLDLLLLTFVETLADSLWFIPGVRRHVRAMRDLCEVVADDAAVAAGATRETLAEALVRVREGLGVQPSLAPLAAVRPGSLLVRRVRRLLGEDGPAAPPRWGFHHPVGRVVIVLSVALTVLKTIIGGNP